MFFVSKRVRRCVKFFFLRVAYRSEMTRNVIESYFRTSKMATGGHFVKN